MATLDAATDQFDFADQMALISSEVLRFRIKNKKRLTPAQQKQLEKLEMDLDKATAKIRAQGIAELGNLTKKARAEVEEAAKQAEAFINKIKVIEKAVGVVTAVLGLGLAISSGAGIPAILQATKAVKNAVDTSA